jgi:hypothetical protein
MLTTPEADGRSLARHLDDILPALRRLDSLLADAIGRAEATYGTVGGDPWRGLSISAQEADRLLGLEPGDPARHLATLGPVVLVAGDADRDGGGLGMFGVIERSFALSGFELDVLVIALAPELDLRYERLYAYLQDDVARRRPTVNLVLDLLCRSAADKLRRRAHFAPAAPLVRSGLVRLDPDPAQPAPPLLAHAVTLAEPVVRLLLGEPSPPAPAPFRRVVTPGAVHDLPPALRRLPALVSAQAGCVYLHGGTGAARCEAAEAVAGAAGTPLVVVDVAGAAAAVALGEALPAALLDARLRGAVLCLDGFDALHGEGQRAQQRLALEQLAGWPGGAVLTGAHPWVPTGGLPLHVIDVAVTVPTVDERRACWRRHLTAAGTDLDAATVGALAARFALTAGQIEVAVTAAVGAAALSGSGARPGAAELFAAARAHRGHALDDLGRRVEPRFGWDDLVLPPDQVEQLREICRYVEHRHVALERWGFGRKVASGQGAAVLFSGASGTGKTMAAEVVAGDLGLALYKVDLARVVSKYIGETEKRLERVFAAAEGGNVVLLFDEADALFGKRSEVRDARDRYANTEIAYLLQRMEAYDGVSVLATNLRRNLDDAFLRRLTAAVEFPHPTAALRLAIWRKVWPPEAPLDARLDLEFMAAQFELPGGHIRNVALNAAALAAADGGPIGMGHLLRATHRELQKTGRQPVPADFGAYRHLLGWGDVERDGAA